MTLKPIKERYPKPVWLKLSEDELKKIITDLSEKYRPAQIGLILRDQYGVPTTKVFGKKLGKYVKELGKNTNFELQNAEAKVEKMKEHIKTNVSDKKAKHKSQKAFSRLNTTKKYNKA